MTKFINTPLGVRMTNSVFYPFFSIGVKYISPYTYFYKYLLIIYKFEFLKLFKYSNAEFANISLYFICHILNFKREVIRPP